MTRWFLPAAVLTALATASPAQESHPPAAVGTWTRTAEEHKVKLEIKAEVLRLIISGSDGASVSLTADYALSKDGILLGILRTHAADAKDKGDADDRLNKRLFYFRVAADDKTLTVSDVNYGKSGGDEIKGLVEGKYRRVKTKPVAACCRVPDGPPPTSRPPSCQANAPVYPPLPSTYNRPAVPCPSGDEAKVDLGVVCKAFALALDRFGILDALSPPASSMTLPEPRYLQHPPQFIPADPAFPLSRELAPTPAPKPESAIPGLVKVIGGLLENVGFINAYSPDPNLRMKELIHQSEDLRQIENEFTRFWFTDQPSHLTAEMQAKKETPKPECTIQDVWATLVRWSGCGGEPNGRLDELINQSEDSGPIDWVPKRWTCPLSPLKYDRIHGGIQ
jgi:hypothetical protein